MNALWSVMRSTGINFDTGGLQTRKVGLLGFVILLHLAFFYALCSNAIKPVSNVSPREVMVYFITPQSAPEPGPLKALPVPPKPLPMPRNSAPSHPAPPLNPVRPALVPPPVAVAAPVPQVAEAAPAIAAAPTAAPSTAAPADPAQPKQVSGIAYIETPVVKYPSASRHLGEEGVVQFRVLVNVNGKAEKVDIIKSSGFPRLDDEAQRAVLRAVFKPHIEDGKPVVVSTTGVINFKLDR